MPNTRHLTHRLAACVCALLACTALSAQAATATRTSSFAYDPVSGLLVKEIIEPGNSQLCMVTEYGYDVFGNKTSAATRNCNGSAGEAAAPAPGSDAVIASRTSTSTFDVRGQFAVTSTNALGHTETRSYDMRFGAVATLTGPNGLTTTWSYDGFGRKIVETRADGTTTAWNYQQTCALSAANTGSTIGYCIATSHSGIAQPSYTYYDTLHRPVLSSRINMAGSDWIDEGNTWYDDKGRVDKTYLPYERAQFASAKYASYFYDDLNRVTGQTAPDNSISTINYAGLTTTSTNALNQTKTTVKNSQGQTVTVTDTQANTVSYLYDPFGNLTKTTDALGNVTILSYDPRGRKIAMNDPDMGYWTYFYNALGELIRQKDAKLQTTTMQYDKLGRMTSRNEPDLASTWVYDTAAKGIGKLTKASAANGYSRTHSYDALGRPASTSTIIDKPTTPYVDSTGYDAYGRINTQTYPASAGHPAGFAVKNIYNANGYLIQVVNAATPATVYWTANAMDAAGHLTQQTYGNGIITEQIYDPATGRLTDQYAGVGSAVQNMSYHYDVLGNLDWRTDANSNLTESYVYDTLNRVITATAVSGAVNTVTNYAYNDIGNLTCKSDLSACSQTASNYSYNASGAGAVRPHAVAGITGSVNGVTNPAYAYDANGNMSSGAGRSTTWTSFNMPNQITNGTKKVTLWYSPEHERTKEQLADKSVVIVLSPRYDTGLHFEKKYLAANGSLTGKIEYEHYLYAGGLMFGQYITTTTSNGTTLASTELKYYSKDHLGSIVAITNATGTVTQRLSYDVWGKRRYPNGTADPNGLLNSKDMDHGYTGHEHLDEVGLIHMNGRLYDPRIGRFVSADPMIQAPGNLQSYNRYSYVLNNPLSYTDPSGYLSLFGKKILPGVLNNNNAKIVAVVVISYYTGGLVQSAMYNGIVGSAAASAAAAGTTLTATQVGVMYTASMAAGGAVSGFVSGGLVGGNLQSAINGATTGAIFGGLNTYGSLNNFNSFQSIGSNAVTGGVTARMQGGSFADGFKYAGLSAGAGETYKYVAEFAANPLPGGDAVNKYDPLAPAVEGANNFGSISKFATTNPCGVCEGGTFSKIMNVIPGMNAIAGVHDNIRNYIIQNGGKTIDLIMNVPTMPLAAGLTYAALLTGPLSVQLAVDR